MSVFTNEEKEFCERVVSNLQLIKEREGQNDKFNEVTNLFCYFSCFVMNLKESTFDALGTALSDSLKTRFHIPNSVHDSTVSEFIKNLRNAVAHFPTNVNFDGKGEQQIKRLELRTDSGWKCEFPIDDMRKFMIEVTKYCISE